MLRTTHVFALISLSTLSWAQADTTKVKVVTSAPLEMKAAASNTIASSASSSAVAGAPVISGDFTLSSAHPKCVQGKTTEERAKCSAGEVLREIRAHLQGAPPKSLDVVVVEFDIDQYGDVKAINANTGNEAQVGQALIVALHGLPKFEPARKGDARAASHCSFAYAVGDLYNRGVTGEKAAAIGTLPPDSAKTATAISTPPAPTVTTVHSNGHIIMGAFTAPCVHPDCAKAKTAEEKVGCTAGKVLERIKANLKAEAPAYLDVVVVDFDIDEYGEVKTIRANCSSEPELGKAVIVALYGLPKFIPAKKDAARARAHCTFEYPVADLFGKP